MPDEYIYPVIHLAYDDDDSVLCRCPHCQDVISLAGESFEDVAGEQFQCRCGGWLGVDYDPVLVFPDEIPPNKGVPE